jgi:hypothetical protein
MDIGLCGCIGGDVPDYGHYRVALTVVIGKIGSNGQWLGKLEPLLHPLEAPWPVAQQNPIQETGRANGDQRRKPAVPKFCGKIRRCEKDPIDGFHKPNGEQPYRRKDGQEFQQVDNINGDDLSMIKRLAGDLIFLRKGF